MVRVVTTAGVVTTLAGNGTTGYFDGPCLSATFDLPQDICYDAQGNLFVSDDNNNVIRKLVNINPKGVEEYSDDQLLTLFPNPSHDLLSIKNNNISSIQIFDMNGKLMKEVIVSDKSDQFTLSVAELAKGEYIIIAIGEEKRATARFIRE